MIGIQNGACLQRTPDNTSFTCILTETDALPVTTLGKIERMGEKKFALTGLPVGGPYSFTLTCDSVTHTLTDIYVGDVWLLGGQSNMEGAGRVTPYDLACKKSPDPAVRAFYMDDTWGAALPLLHTPWKSADRQISEVNLRYRAESVWKNYDTPGLPPYDSELRGVGPGFGFAKKLYELTGIPQAVIPNAVGGASMQDWNPDESEKPNYYTAMIRRLSAAGGRVRGLYWDQGEAQTGDAGYYVDIMTHFIARVREDCGNAFLPVVINQIAATTLPWITEKNCHLDWSAIRELQRILPEKIPCMDAVPTLGAGMSDLIHKDSPSQTAIGAAAALSMAALCGFGGEPSVTFDHFSILPDPVIPFLYDLEIHYNHVVGSLSASGVPSGVSIQLSEEEPPVFWPNIHIQNLELKGNVIAVHNELSLEQLQNATIWYGLGHNAVCNIRDAAGRLLPAMGPIRIKDYLKEN